MDAILQRSSKVFVFGNPNITSCSQEENQLFFDKSIDLTTIENYFSSNRNLISEESLNNIENFINSTLDFITGNKILMARITTALAISIFLASNPTYIFAYSYMEQFSELGKGLVSVISIGLQKGILIFTALRLFGEYVNGANNHRICQILKECIALFLAITIIPVLPNLFKIFLP